MCTRHASAIARAADCIGFGIEHLELRIPGSSGEVAISSLTLDSKGSFHDGRHTAITNDAAAGNAPMAVMKRAGHADFKTTQTYIDLAGETFRAEAERLGKRIFAGVRRTPQNAAHAVRT